MRNAKASDASPAAEAAGFSPPKKGQKKSAPFDDVPAMTWSAGADGRPTQLSVALCWDLEVGLAAESWPDAAAHPDDRASLASAWTQGVQAGATFNVEFRQRGPDGDYRWRRVTARPHRDARGRLVGWYGAVFDVDELRACREQLAESERSQHRFLAILGHELRNPLATIVSALQVLETLQADVGEALEMREIIRRQALLLKRLVDELLDVSRIARNKVTLQRARVDLTGLVREAAAEWRRTAEASQIALALSAPDGPLPCEGDSHRLRQAFDHLVGNALKFTAPGGRVVVTLEAGDDRATFRVADDGIGMTADLLTQIFRPFAQGETSLDRSQGGLGLGLPLAKGLVELHGGRIEAVSPGPHQGSTFTIELPLAPTASAADEPSPADGTARQALRVLVIEDRRDAALPLLKLLRSEGHAVELAVDGTRGLEAALRFRPQVVLCDIGLPGIDGYEVARRFRGHDALRSVFLVAVTGYGLETDRQRALAAGFDQHLAKPIDFAELRSVIDVASRTGAAL